ncbi:hypothetical protein [Siminovitchia sp. 179-K 8D1 HS]|uniref:hypothetical protein n=1 Tax=Siminovitchia sp. 179-K 8D1 HS TaxID=3142385 RepID=UPI0039A12B4D
MKYIDIRLTKSKAKEIIDMFEDWDSEFAVDDPDYKQGYINSTKDFLSILQLSRWEIEAIANQ